MRDEQLSTSDSAVSHLEERKRVTLERLSNTSPQILYRESKLERCIALRDLRTCGRLVQHNLGGCGHACLCGDCLYRHQYCPLCGDEISFDKNTPVLRLFDDLLFSKLVSMSIDDEFFKKETLVFLSVDVRRLFNFFDIALENNVSSVIFRYVEEICLSVNSSSVDPPSSLLMEGAMIIAWCYKVFQKLKLPLKEIFNLGPKRIMAGDKMTAMAEIARKLKDVTRILATMDFPSSDTLPESALELRRLIESVKRSVQYIEATMWAAKHGFFLGKKHRFGDTPMWRSAFRQKKQARSNQIWPDFDAKLMAPGSAPAATLFIEEAMENLLTQTELQDSVVDCGKELEFLRARDDSFHSQGSDSATILFPFASSALYSMDSIQSAIHAIFLSHSSSLIEAKSSILLYNLLDRFWCAEESEWRPIVEDYMRTFNTPSASLLETFVLFLLDEDSPSAVAEASRTLLSTNPAPEIHPQALRVLLERGEPETALSCLRTFKKRHETQEMDLSADLVVSAIRICIENSAVEEGFWFLQAFFKAEEEKLYSHGNCESEREFDRMLASLVGEFCYLCIKKRLVDRMVLLPWNIDEETAVESCLMKRVELLPASACGTFLVIYYLKRERRFKAKKVHEQLTQIEDKFIASNADEDAAASLLRMRDHRAFFVETSLALKTDPGKVREEQRKQFQGMRPPRRRPVRPQERNAAMADISGDLELPPLAEINGNFDPPAAQPTPKFHGFSTRDPVKEVTTALGSLGTLGTISASRRYPAAVDWSLFGGGSPSVYGSARLGTDSQKGAPDPSLMGSEGGTLFGTAEAATLSTPGTRKVHGGDGFGSLLTRGRESLTSTERRFRLVTSPTAEAVGTVVPRALAFEFGTIAVESRDDVILGEKKRSGEVGGALEGEMPEKKSPRQSPRAPRDQRKAQTENLFG